MGVREKWLPPARAAAYRERLARLKREDAECKLEDAERLGRLEREDALDVLLEEKLWTMHL